MGKQKNKGKRVSSQLNMMGIFAVVSCVFLGGLLSYWSRGDLILFFADHERYLESGKESAEAILFLDSLVVAECILVLSRYELFGRVVIDQTFLALRAPFRKPIKMDLSEIRYLGIDYGIYSGERHFWLYFSKEPLEKKYYHKIHRAKITKDFVKIEYSQVLFDFLVSELPTSLGKRLDNSSSILKLFSSKQGT